MSGKRDGGTRPWKVLGCWLVRFATKMGWGTQERATAAQTDGSWTTLEQAWTRGRGVELKKWGREGQGEARRGEAGRCEVFGESGMGWDAASLSLSPSAHVLAPAPYAGTECLQ